MMIGENTGQSVEKNRDGENNVRMLQVTIYTDDNAESVQLARPSGEDSNPPSNSQLLIIPVGNAYKVGVMLDDGIEPEVNEGEKEFYSIAGGAKKARVKLKADGLIAILNENESLKTLIGDLIDAINGIVTTGSPETHTVNGASQAALNVIKSRFNTLIGAP